MKRTSKIGPPLPIFLPPPLPLEITKNGIPHDKYDVRGIAYTRTDRKDNIYMQRRLYIDETHTALDIFRFAAFLFFALVFDFFRFLVHFFVLMAPLIRC